MNNIEEYRSKLYTSFNYILNNNNVIMVDYNYCLSLLFKSVYLISETLMEDIKIIFKDLNINDINVENEIIKTLDINFKETYLYIFSQIKEDLYNYNTILENTKIKMMVILNKITDKRYPFIELDKETKELYKL